MDQKEHWWPALLGVLTSWIAAAIGRVLLEEKKPDIRRLFGEILLAFVGAILMYSFGMMKNFSLWQIIFYGALAGLGGVRAIEQSFCIIRELSNKLKD